MNQDSIQPFVHPRKTCTGDCCSMQDCRICVRGRDAVMRRFMMAFMYQIAPGKEERVKQLEKRLRRRSRPRRFTKQLDRLRKPRTPNPIIMITAPYATPSAFEQSVGRLNREPAKVEVREFMPNLYRQRLADEPKESTNFLEQTRLTEEILLQFRREDKE